MGSTPWSSQNQSMNPSPAPLTPSSEAGSSNSSQFSSTWGAFGLAQPRSNLSMQLESHPIEGTSLFQRRSNSSNNNGGTGSAFGRRQSMLGVDSAMMDDEQELSTSLNRMGAGAGGGGDVSMSASFDPVLPSNVFSMSSS